MSYQICKITLTQNKFWEISRKPQKEVVEDDEEGEKEQDDLVALGC
jgi:hypothetical protein